MVVDVNSVCKNNNTPMIPQFTIQYRTHCDTARVSPKTVAVAVTLSSQEWAKVDPCFGY